MQEVRSQKRNEGRTRLGRGLKVEKRINTTVKSAPLPLLPIALQDRNIAKQGSCVCVRVYERASSTRIEYHL